MQVLMIYKKEKYVTVYIVILLLLENRFIGKPPNSLVIMQRAVSSLSLMLQRHGKRENKFCSVR